MAEHTIHVTGWDGASTLELRCHAGPDSPCHRQIDEFGVSHPIDFCNAIDWWGNVGPDDLIGSALKGEPPWQVDIEWHYEGPNIGQAKP